MLRIINELTSFLRYTNDRQSVLADNMSRLNIPNQKAYDLEPFNANANLKNNSFDMYLTSSMHIPITEKLRNSNVKAIKDPYDVYINGNNIAPDQQMMKITENATDAQAANNLYKKIMSMLKDAVSNK